MSSPLALPIFDGHNDTLLRLHMAEPEDNDSFFKSDYGHIDLERARAGGLGGGFFAIFVTGDPSVPYKRPHGELPPMLDQSYAQRYATAMAARLFQIERESNGQFKIVRTAGEIEECLKNGTFAAIYHYEGADPIDVEMNHLELAYQAGLRSLGIVWSRPNAFGHGVPFRFPSSPDIGPGLTDAGKRLVTYCNQRGIMLDLSHLNEAGFWDVAKLSSAPLVATHSNVHQLSATPRNLTNEQLDAIKESDGMVGLNFAVSFLRKDGKQDAETPVTTMVNHIDYLVERLGVERVGLGSDFDGATIPAEIKDAAGLPVLIEALRQSGYDNDALQKLTHQNWVRVLRKTWGA